MIRRRIVLIDAAGHVFRELDISDIDNADVRAPITIQVQTQCDMEHWHDGQTIITVPWGRALTDPSWPAMDRTGRIISPLPP